MGPGEYSITQNAEQNSVSYVDHSIRLFFDSIRNTDWYKNTIFVFVADHALTFDIKPRKVLYSAFQIPFFIHLPNSKTLVHVDKTVQQLDLVPTLLDLMHYDQPFMSFGKSMLDTTEGFVVNKIFGNYQLIDGSFLLGYNEQNEQPVYFYNYRSDPELKSNLVNVGESVIDRKRLENKMKAVIQKYNNGLLRHQLLVP
jgi:phosphoglycerol transferase MdoB-like AlkP superfamily enzyme